MQIKKIALTSTALLRGFLVFILLLLLSLWVLGYQVFSTYVVEKQHSLSTIAGSMQNASTNIASRPISFMTLPAKTTRRRCSPTALRKCGCVRTSILWINPIRKPTR